jgi:hypothetical protein
LKFLLLAFVITAVVIALLSIAPVQAADTMLDGWKLSQWCRGDCNLDVYVTKSAVRMVIPKNGLVVLSFAPYIATVIERR